MVKYLTKDFVLNNENFIKSEINLGKIFIYPADTLYGIGCDAQNTVSVAKINQIKKRFNKSLLVIIPNLNWILNNCIINNGQFSFIKNKLPGPYSFILKLKNKNIVSNEVLQNRDTLGVRFFDSYFNKILSKYNILFITTSVNFSGKEPALDIDSIDKSILDNVDYILEKDVEFLGRSSEIFDFSSNDFNVSKISKIR